jgi:hypothetical protein
MEMQKGKRLKNDDSMLFKCPRALALAAERAAAEQMIPIGVVACAGR